VTVGTSNRIKKSYQNEIKNTTKIIGGFEKRIYDLKELDNGRRRGRRIGVRITLDQDMRFGKHVPRECPYCSNQLVESADATPIRRGQTKKGARLAPFFVWLFKLYGLF
jgi:hypothetical protein